MTTTSCPARAGQRPAGQRPAADFPARTKIRGTRNDAPSRAPWLLLTPFLGLFILTFVLPIFVAVRTNFTKVTRSGLFGETGVKSEFAWFSNYAQALADGSFLASIGRMLLFGIVQVPVIVMLSDSRLYPITLGLNTWLSQVDRLPEFYELTTGGVLLSIIPLSFAMVVLQRFWRGGLTEGAVK
ncbi:UNVERIFIED_ORG: ABC-type glycerol-3-phosphate transport system permease component [Arthrobacter sp. UYCu721]